MNHVHKKLLKLRNMKLTVDNCIGMLTQILQAASDNGWLIQGVERPKGTHILIYSGFGGSAKTDGAVGKPEVIGCMTDPSDNDIIHEFKEDPGVELEVSDPALCPHCTTICRLICSS